MIGRSVMIILGAALTVALIVLGLWGWQQAMPIATMAGWEKRTIGAWSVRCAAIALIAAAETILLTLVVERVYRPDAACARVRLSAMFVLTVCTVSAIALGLAGR